MIRFIFYFWIILLAQELRAEKVRKDWAPVPHAALYEYEVADTLSFQSSSLIRQGASPDPFFSTELRPGVYFFRSRSLNHNGKASAWAPVQKIIVKGRGELKFHTPTGGEIIDLPESQNAKAYFEWTTVAGATVYELSLNNAAAKKNLQMTSSIPSLNVENLSPGTWSAKVIAKSSNHIFSESPGIQFEVQVRPLPKPQLEYPREGDQFPAWEMIRVRWLRKVLGTKSSVLLYELSQNSRQLLSEEVVLEQNSTWLKSLAPGRYQVTVKNFVNNTNKYVEESSSFSVEIDPFGQKMRDLGVRTMLLPIGIGLGIASQKTSLTEFAPLGTIQNAGPTTKLADLRIFTPLYRKWGLTIRYNLESIQSEEFTHTVELNTLSSIQERFKFGMGPTYRVEPLGPTRPIIFALLINASRYNAFSDSESFRDFFDVLSFINEISILYSGWNSRYSIEARIQSEIPFLTGQGNFLGSGNIRPLPSLSGEGLLKRRLSQSVRGVLGAEYVFQKISISEKKSVPNRSVDTSSETTDMLFFLKLGFDWDF